MQIEFIAGTEKYYDALILPIWEGKTLSASAQAYDSNWNNLISKTLDQENHFSGKKGETLTLISLIENKAQKVILLGLGQHDSATTLDMEQAGAKLSAMLQTQKINAVVLDCTGSMEATSMAAIANGFLLRAYAFDTYKTLAEKKEMHILYMACGNASQDAKAAYDPLKATTEGVHLARDLSNEPPNSLNPTSYAQRINEVMKPLGVKVKIIDHKMLEKMGAGAILGVGQGSETPPCFVVMEYAGGKKPTKKKGWETALVGKGITFDTGGYSLKPPASQIDMKFDMCGSAAVVGAMQAIAARKIEANVVGIVALAENMVSSKAYRVNDIVTSLSGKTIEVLNTDAEGRLVLADALTYIQQEYAPEKVIDLATLTGAAMVALGSEYGAVYSTDDDLYATAETAAKHTGEKVWRMPLDEIFDKEMEGNAADLRNIGKARWGGSCTAAAFLKQFIDADRTWMHMDIAGTPYAAKPTTFAPIGANGYGVRLLLSMLCDAG